MMWFGWLTKGRCEISVFDSLTLVAEIVGLYLVFSLINSISKKRRHRE